MGLIEVIKRVRKEGGAIGHFNFAELTVLRAIVNAARRLKTPVIVGLSEKERAFFDSRWAVELVKEIRTSDVPRTSDVQIFINADHTHSFAAVKEAVAAGFDAILFDGGRWPLAKNIRETRRAVEYIKSKNPQIAVEGELGYIGGSSSLLKRLPPGAAVAPEQLTTVEEARQFVAETKVDLLAPAVGTVHGIVEGRRTKLDLERIALLSSSGLTGGSTSWIPPRLAGGNDRVPIVLHGASELSAASARAAVRAGVSVVHVNTEIRVAWRRALDRSLAADKNEAAPYRLLEKPRAAAEKVVYEWMRVISN